MNRLLALLPLVGIPGLSGCSGDSIREGIWELAIQAQVSDTRQPTSIQKRLVKVLVGPDDAGEGEVAEITPLAEPAQPEAGGTGAPQAKDAALELKPMYADIRRRREEQRAAVSIHASDAYWIWQMRGYVKDSEHIVGVSLGAHARTKNVVLEGRWSMHWVRDS